MKKFFYFLVAMSIILAPIVGMAQEQEVANESVELAPENKPVDLSPLAKLAAAIGASVAVIGAASGIGRIGEAALNAISRQPEATADIRSGMIVSAALIEGVAFFAIVVCLLIVFI